MDYGDILSPIVNLFIALGGWAFAFYQIKLNRQDDLRARKLSKINSVFSYLDEHAELIEVYRLFGRQTTYIARDEKGELLTDESGSFVIEKTDLEPEQRFLKALEALEQTDLQSVIAQQIIKLKLKNGRVSDILIELEPTGTLNKQLAQLIYMTTDSVEKGLESNDFGTLMQILNDISSIRQDLRTSLESMINDKE